MFNFRMLDKQDTFYELSADSSQPVLHKEMSGTDITIRVYTSSLPIWAPADIAAT